MFAHSLFRWPSFFCCFFVELLSTIIKIVDNIQQVLCSTTSFVFRIGTSALPHGRATAPISKPIYFGWILSVKLQTPIFSSGCTMVRSSRGSSRPETRVGLRPLEVSQKRP